MEKILSILVVSFLIKIWQKLPILAFNFFYSVWQKNQSEFFMTTNGNDRFYALGEQWKIPNIDFFTVDKINVCDKYATKHILSTTWPTFFESVNNEKRFLTYERKQKLAWKCLKNLGSVYLDICFYWRIIRNENLADAIYVFGFVIRYEKNLWM